MKIERIGFMTPGDMGQAVALQLKNKGFTVNTALEKRSDRSRKMAAEIGLTDVGSIARLAAESDLIMSVMNPGAAVDFAREAAAAIRAQSNKPTFIDCNAVAPSTMREIDELMKSAGARCLDGGIIGPPPRGKAKTNLYVSGPGAADLEALAGPQLLVHVVSERIADASALKMCYGALNKGTQALWLEILIAAQRLGVDRLLEEQLRQSRADIHDWALGQFPVLPPKAYRWVPEMLEISKTMRSAGITPKVFQGAAEIYEFVAGTALGKETPENRDKSRTGRDVVRSLAGERSRS